MWSTCDVNEAQTLSIWSVGGVSQRVKILDNISAKYVWFDTCMLYSCVLSMVIFVQLHLSSQVHVDQTFQCFYYILEQNWAEWACPTKVYCQFLTGHQGFFNI